MVDAASRMIKAREDYQNIAWVFVRWVAEGDVEFGVKV